MIKEEIIRDSENQTGILNEAQSPRFKPWMRVVAGLVLTVFCWQDFVSAAIQPALSPVLFSAPTQQRRLPIASLLTPSLYANDYHVSTGVDEGSYSATFDGASMSPTYTINPGVHTPTMPSFNTASIRNVGNVSYVFNDAYVVNDLGFMDGTGQYALPQAIAQTSYEGSKLHTVPVQFVGGLNAITGMPTLGEDGAIKDPKHFEEGFVDNFEIKDVTADVRSGTVDTGNHYMDHLDKHNLPVFSYGAAGASGLLTGTTVQSKKFINSDLGYRTNGGGAHSGQQGVERTDIPYIYTMADAANNDYVVIGITPEAPTGRFNYTDGAYVVPGDTVVGYKGDRLSGIGVDPATRNDTWSPNGEQYTLRVNPEGNISPIHAIQSYSGIVPHITKGARSTWANDKGHTYIQQGTFSGGTSKNTIVAWGQGIIKNIEGTFEKASDLTRGNIAGQTVITSARGTYNSYSAVDSLTGLTYGGEDTESIVPIESEGDAIVGKDGVIIGPTFEPIRNDSDELLDHKASHAPAIASDASSIPSEREPVLTRGTIVTDHANNVNLYNVSYIEFNQGTTHELLTGDGARWSGGTRENRAKFGTSQYINLSANAVKNGRIDLADYDVGQEGLKSPIAEGIVVDNDVIVQFQDPEGALSTEANLAGQIWRYLDPSDETIKFNVDEDHDQNIPVTELTAKFAKDGSSATLKDVYAKEDGLYIGGDKGTIIAQRIAAGDKPNPDDTRPIATKPTSLWSVFGRDIENNLVEFTTKGSVTETNPYFEFEVLLDGGVSLRSTWQDKGARTYIVEGGQLTAWGHEWKPENEIGLVAFKEYKGENEQSSVLPVGGANDYATQIKLNEGWKLAYRTDATLSGDDILDVLSGYLKSQLESKGNIAWDKFKVENSDKEVGLTQKEIDLLEGGEFDLAARSLFGRLNPNSTPSEIKVSFDVTGSLVSGWYSWVSEDKDNLGEGLVASKSNWELGTVKASSSITVDGKSYGDKPFKVSDDGSIIEKDQTVELLNIPLSSAGEAARQSYSGEATITATDSNFVVGVTSESGIPITFSQGPLANANPFLAQDNTLVAGGATPDIFHFATYNFQGEVPFALGGMLRQHEGTVSFNQDGVPQYAEGYRTSALFREPFIGSNESHIAALELDGKVSSVYFLGVREPDAWWKATSNINLVPDVAKGQTPNFSDYFSFSNKGIYYNEAISPEATAYVATIDRARWDNNLNTFRISFNTTDIIKTFTNNYVPPEGSTTQEGLSQRLAEVETKTSP